MTEVGERRIVTVLMADVADSTSIGEQLGPERSKFLFDEIVRLIAAEVRRFGGTVAQLSGDGLFALFGAPDAHEDDSERAVRAALAAQETLRDYAGQVEAAYGVALAARFGINTGPVVLVGDDAPQEERYNALGDTVNVAARLQGVAGEGGLAVGPATAQQIETRFELESRGEVELKGKSAPVEVFLVTGERPDAPAIRTETRFVGRTAELAALEEVIADVAAGRGGIVSITGEPGIGKSRLVAETKARFSAEVAFLVGHAAAYAETFAYWPARELLRDWLGLGISDPEARARLELKTALSRLGVGAEASYPFLATLLGLALEADLAQQIGELSRDSVQRQTTEAVYEVLAAIARERPLCLVLEDLHWADEATLELLEALLPLTDEEAVALVLLYRSEREHRSWQLGQLARQRFPHRFRELELRPLGRDDALAIADAELPEHVADLLVERAGGNPLFLEEALRDLVERGALRRGNGRYELAVGIDELEVPALVQEALQARLDRLSPSTKEVAGAASVIGRTFGLPLLEQVAPQAELRRSLSELQRLELVVEERRRPSPEYSFRHGLVQEAAYAGLTEARRRSLHLGVGEALEQLAEEEAPEAYAVLGRHFAEGDEPERAASYLLKAGDVARSLDAEDEALGHYRRALEFLDRLGDVGRARETLLRIALTHHLAFEFEQANAAYSEAFKRHVPDPPRVELTEVLSTDVPDFGTLAPGMSYWAPAWETIPNVFRGLFDLDSDFSVRPALAAGLSISPDGTRYRIRIREDSHWSDGEPLTAKDFAYTLQTMREQRVVTAHLLDPIVEVTAPDEQTLELQLAEPSEYLLYVLATPPTFPWPRHRCEALGDDWHLPENLVGNGPFTLTPGVEDGFGLEASPTWSLPRGNIRSVELEFSSGFTVDRWIDGHLDVKRLSSWSEELQSAPDTILESSPGLETYYLAFYSDTTPFDDVHVRKAFAHAIDRRPFAALPFAEQASERGGLIPPAMPAHSHRVGLPHDPELARSLLAEAGYPEGRGLPVLTLASRSPTRGNILAEQWRETLGAETRVIEFEKKPREIPGGAHALNDGWIADYPDPRNYLEEIRAGERQRLRQDDRVQALLKRAKTLRDRRARIRAYNEAEAAWIAEDAEIVPLEYIGQVALRRPWVHGYWLSPTVAAPFDAVTIRGRPKRGDRGV